MILAFLLLSLTALICQHSRHSTTHLLKMADDRQTSMQFCNECNNLMYPKEVKDETDPTESRLVYVCKAANCIVSAKSRKQCIDAESTMVWKHVVQHSMKYVPGPSSFLSRHALLYPCSLFRYSLNQLPFLDISPPPPLLTSSLPPVMSL